MEQCKYFNICHLPKDNDQYCILHSPNRDKNYQVFCNMLKKHCEINGNKFNHIIFPEQINHIDFDLEQEVDFSDCVFLGEVNFTNRYFEQNTLFDRAEFNSDVSFSKTTFFNKASFIGTKFRNNTTFEGTKFSRLAYFNNAVFDNRAIFSNADVSNDGIENYDYIFRGSNVDFRHVHLSPNSKLVFRRADLSVVKFIGTPLIYAEFIRVNWALSNGRKLLFDELRTVEKAKSLKEGYLIKQLPFDDIEKLYRDLKYNHEIKMDRNSAGDFHYGEKEMQRLNPNNSRALRWVLLYPYWGLSGYSESYMRPLLWGFLLLILCAICYLLPGLATQNGKALSILEKTDILQSLHYSLQTMFLLKPTDIQLTLIGKCIKTTESILGPFFIALFALAVRQKLKR